MPTSGVLQPGAQDPEAAAAAKRRQSQISMRRNAENKKLSVANKKARMAALKKKGSQKYKYQQIQGDTDFGIGEAGPGIPYSVKSWTLPEKQVAPKKTSVAPPTPKWLAGMPLWGTKGNLPWHQQRDWRQAAIRRRLNSG